MIDPTKFRSAKLMKKTAKVDRTKLTLLLVAAAIVIPLMFLLRSASPPSAPKREAEREQPLVRPERPRGPGTVRVEEVEGAGQPAVPEPGNTWEQLTAEEEALILADARNKTFSVEAKPLCYLLAKARRLPEQTPETKEQEQIAWRDYLHKAEDVKGQIDVVTGTVFNLAKQEFEDSYYGMTEAYTGQIIDRDHHYYTFYVSEPPAATEIVERDLVKLRGYFMKVWIYATRMSTVKGTPVLVGRELVPVELPKQRVWEQVIVPVVLVTVLIIFIGGYLEAKRRRNFAAVRLAKRKQRRPENINALAKARAVAAGESEEEPQAAEAEPGTTADEEEDKEEGEEKEGQEEEEGPSEGSREEP